MSIKVLSYNTSWESSQPKPDWNNPNPYEPEARDEQAQLDAKHSVAINEWKSKNPGKPWWTLNNWKKAQQTQDDKWISDWGDGDDGIGKMCGDSNNPTKVKRCRDNIFGIIKNGNYDLVGMQEYVHEWKGQPVYSERMTTLEPKLKLVVNIKPIKITFDGGKTYKQVDIASLYNTEKFTLKGQCSMELLQNDGRPVLVLHLVTKNKNEHILFVNAHMPQPNSVKKMKGYGNGDGEAKVIGDNITNLIKQELPQAAGDPNIRIIMVTDSNDFTDSYVKNIKILGKELFHGKNYKKTCCTTLVNDKKWTPSQYYKGPFPGVKVGEEITLTRNNRRLRFGDIILDSDSEIKSEDYKYPEETPGQPYSDHAPIEITLQENIVEEKLVGGKRKSRKRGKKKTRKYKKIRRKKITKRKRTSKKRTSGKRNKGSVRAK